MQPVPPAAEYDTVWHAVPNHSWKIIQHFFEQLKVKQNFKSLSLVTPAFCVCHVKLVPARYSKRPWCRYALQC